MFVVARVFFWIIGLMFFVGICGSALVVMLTSIEDIRDLRQKEESETPSQPPVVQTGGEDQP
jgi:hypothetical protein